MTVPLATDEAMQDATVAAVRSVLAQHPKKAVDDPSLAPAGVMLLLYPRDGEYVILLNKRSDLVEDHKGEVSFPGGRKDEGDRTLLDTALREASEEMGINPQDVVVLGELDDVATRTSYVVSTFVGTIPPSYCFSPNEREVAEVIEVPLRALKDESSHRGEARILDGQPVSNPAYAYGGHVIFGATARILSGFLKLMASVP